MQNQEKATVGSGLTIQMHVVHVVADQLEIRRKAARRENVIRLQKLKSARIDDLITLNQQAPEHRQLENAALDFMNVGGIDELKAKVIKGLR